MLVAIFELTARNDGRVCVMRRSAAFVNSAIHQYMLGLDEYTALAHSLGLSCCVAIRGAHALRKYCSICCLRINIAVSYDNHTRHITQTSRLLTRPHYITVCTRKPHTECVSCTACSKDNSHTNGGYRQRSGCQHCTNRLTDEQ